MHFAYPLPWWLGMLLAAAVGALAFLEYRRPSVPLTRVQRGVLVGLRACVLAALVLCLFRPIVLLPSASSRDAIVPVLVDVSRSMRIGDADGQTRLARAAALLRSQLLPDLSRSFRTEVYSVGDSLAPASLDRLSPDAHQTDLVGALAAVRERYHGQPVAGILLLSDGGDTGRLSAAANAAGPPVFAVGIGLPDRVTDREVLGVTASDPRLDQASVDLHVSAISSGFGRTPFELRVLENGRVIDSRRVVPPADSSPIEQVFTVSPNPSIPTVYAAEIPVDEREPVTENNTRSVLVSPAGRKRRLLLVQGAPGFEHAFMSRAFARDPGLEVDSVVRKGRNAEGQDTFIVQAGAGRAMSLTTGFPSQREDLYSYDAIIIANAAGDFFTRSQLANVADFVSERGGGLLVLGGQSFTQGGLISTPLEEALPVELSDRRGGLVHTSIEADGGAPHNKVVITKEGEDHPVIRLGESAEETRRLWSALPPLGASAPLGGPRPGAIVLAVTQTVGGAVYPLVAVQRYGQGRSMVFGGEASWRWKMMVPSTDRTYEFFWRRAARWLAGPSPDPVAVTVPAAVEPGDTITVDVVARDKAFRPVADAIVTATLTLPGGDARPLKLKPGEEGTGYRQTGTVRIERPGLHRILAEARREATSLGTADRWFHAGGADREFADPRLNEGFLRRLAGASGGRYVRAADASRLVSSLQETVPHDAAPEQRDLWHEPWVFALLVALLSGEWILRRWWGLR